MDLTAPARDIEELVAAFAAMEGTELAQMKELWRARNFSFIHEARPKDVIPSFYAQGLFSSALSNMVGDASFSWRLGGLYVLYTLHGTQPQEPCFRIYLSIEELEALHSMAKEIKKKRLTTALKVVRKMFSENMFLFGSVSANQKRIATTVARLAKQANTRVHQARSRLLTNLPVEQHLEGHLGKELGLHELVQLTEEYAAAKRRALCGNLDGMEEHDVGGNEEFERTLGTDLMKDANSWDAQRVKLLTLVRQQGSKQGPVSANSIGVGSDRQNASESRNVRQQRTVADYEKELRENRRLSEFERELVEQLDEALDE